MSALQIDVTKSMSLSVQRTIDSHQEDLRRVLPLPSQSRCSPTERIVRTAAVRGSHSHSRLRESFADSLLFPVVRVDFLGKGSSASVFRAVRLTDLRLCAEKSVAVADASKRQQMVREVELLQSLCGDSASPFVVQLFGVLPNPRDGTLSVLLEYMDLGSLQQVVSRGGCKDEHLLSSLARQVTSGLAFLHARRLVHRDLKPSNILLSATKKTAKLSDFGIARTLDMGVSLAESFVGTFEYMAPERLSGESYGFVSDVWSLGMTLRAVACGLCPSSGRRDFWEILQQAQTKERMSPQSEGCSGDFADFVSLATQNDHRLRPTADALLSHSFLRDASLSFTDKQVDHLRLIVSGGKERDRDQKKRSPRALSEQDRARRSRELTAMLVRKWTDFVHEIFDADDLHQRVLSADDFKTLSVSKETLSQLGKGLEIDEGILTRGFRKALKETRKFVGDRLRFLQELPSRWAESKEDANNNDNSNDSKNNAVPAEELSRIDIAIEPPRAISPAGLSVQRIKESERCLVNLSASLNKSMRSLCRPSTQQQGGEKMSNVPEENDGEDCYDDDFDEAHEEYENEYQSDFES